MDQTRFNDLAAAYGGAIDRWPLAERDAAWGFLAAEGATAQAVLAEAALLDDHLAELRAPQPSVALRQAILATAPAQRPGRSRLWRWVTGAGLGAGLAAACAAGLVAGVSAGGVADDLRADSLMASGDEAATAFAPTDAEGNS